VAIDGAGVTVGAGVGAGAAARVADGGSVGVGAGDIAGTAVGAAPEQPTRMLKAIEVARIGRFIGFLQAARSYEFV
jgi:hypothetical protein